MVDYGTLLTQTGVKLADILSSFAVGIVDALIAVLVIVVFLILGFVVAGIINKVLTIILDKTKFEKVAKDLGFGIKIAGFSITQIVLGLIKIYIVIAFLGAAVDLVSLGMITDIIKSIVNYIPKLIQGMAIILGAMILIEYLVRLIRATQKLALANIFTIAIQVFVAYIALVMALPLILPNVDTTILTTAFELFVGAGAIGTGIGLAIAFGWGLKDSVAQSAKKHPKIFDDMFKTIDKK